MVDSERLLKEFKRLAEFDAESYEERRIADYLKQRLTDLGLEVTEDAAGELLNIKSGKDKERSAGNIYGFLKGNVPGDPILFSAHMDTVSPGKGKKAVFHEDGMITSDGSTVLGADDVSGLVSILEALTVIKEKNLPHPDIEVVFATAEEPYAQGSRLFDFTRLKARMAYTLDLSGPVGGIAVAAPSIFSFGIQVHGKSAHAGFCPEKGVNAVAIAARAISRIPQGHVEPDTTVNIGTVVGGVQRNIVPESLSVTGEVRSMDHQKALKWVKKIGEIFEEEAIQAGGTAEESYEEEFKAYRIQEEEPVVKRFYQACQSLGLEAGEPQETFGGSDNNHFAAHGIRGVVIACAMNEVHTRQEYTTVQELVRSAELTLALATIKGKEQ